MTSNPEITPLPDEIVRALADLGDLEAPAELEDRVSLALLGQATAPAELAPRVELAVFGPAAAPASLWQRVVPQVQAEGASRRRARVLSFRRVLSAAAAVLLVSIGIGVYGPGSGTVEGPPDLVAQYQAHRAEVLSKVILIEVDPAEFSGIARDLGAHMGGAR